MNRSQQLKAGSRGNLLTERSRRQLQPDSKTEPSLFPSTGNRFWRGFGQLVPVRLQICPSRTAAFGALSRSIRAETKIGERGEDRCQRVWQCRLAPFSFSLCAPLGNSNWK